MSTVETLEEFYRQKYATLPEVHPNDPGHFNVFRVEDHAPTQKAPLKYARREFYKISLIKGHFVYHYADKSLEVNGATLLFFNPEVPYTMEHLGEERTGFFCIFRGEYFSDHLRNSLRELPMYAPGGKPAYMLDEAQFRSFGAIYEKMLEEIQSDYRFKNDLIRNYIMEIIHNALKIQPSEKLYRNIDANARITNVFMELLERQFPVEPTTQKFQLRSAKDFAEKLNVHVNHLNRAIKLSTGKTTTEHIAERLMGEAKAMLRHTHRNVSEISYSLGFEEPAHFNHFFKKHAGMTPTAFRA